MRFFKQVKRLPFWLVVLSFLALLGLNRYWLHWFPKYDKFQKAYNKERCKIGILPIPKDWVTRDDENDNKFWAPKEWYKNTAGKTFRLSKVIIVNRKQLVRETDRIGKFDSTENYKYTMEITYNYRNKLWTNKITTYKSEFRQMDTFISNEARDSILNTWNFNYQANLCR